MTFTASFLQTIRDLNPRSIYRNIPVLLGVPFITGLILGVIIIFVPVPYIFFVIGGLLFLYLILFKIEIAIIFALLVQNQLARFNYLGGDTPFHPNGIMGLAIIAGAAFHFVTHKLDLKRFKSFWGFASFLLISAISLLYAQPYFMDGLTIFLRLVAAFSIYTVLLHKIESIKVVKWIFGAIIAAQVLPTLSGLLNRVGLTGIFFTDTTVRLGDSGVGVYMAIISLICIAFLFNTKITRSRVLWLMLSALFIAGLFFSYGRSGWIGFAFGLLLLGAVQNKKMLFILPLSFILVIILVPAIGQRFGDISLTSLGEDGPDTLSGRIRYWMAAIEIFKDNPILGVGLGTGRFKVGAFLGDYSMMIHNDYVSTLVETGIIGFMIFLVWYTKWIIDLSRTYRSSPQGFEKVASLSSFIIICAVMVMCFTDNILLDTYDMYPLCAMIAATLSIPRVLQSRKVVGNIDLSRE